MAYEIFQEDGKYGYNVMNEEGFLVDFDRYFSDKDDAHWVVRTRYPGIRELGE